MLRPKLIGNGETQMRRVHNMIKEPHQPAVTGNYDICTFEDAQGYARRLQARYERIKSQSNGQGAATYCILPCIYDFTHAMQRQNKIERIHQSCISRMPNSRIQPRSDFAVVMLLLALENPTVFNRHWRHRLNTALEKAAENRIPTRLVAHWVYEQGGLDRLRG